MKNVTLICAMAAVAAFAGPAHAIFKCTTAKGVVYQDRNHDGSYSMGEGVGGVTVSTSQGNYAYTSVSGGYAIPLVTTSGSVTKRRDT